MTAFTTAFKVVKFELSDLTRSRWLVAYVLVLALATDALFRFNGADQRAVLGLVNITLLLVPLVAVIFGTMHLYARRDFIELLLAQPLRRRDIFLGLYLGLTIPVSAGMIAGIALPAAWHGAWGQSPGGPLLTLLGVALALTAAFVALAFCIAVRCEDRLRGLAIAMALWMAFAVLYDGAVLLVGSIFADANLERPMLAAMLANPVDLARVVMLLQLDISALMGYTGAVLKSAVGSAQGVVLAAVALSLWVAVPLWLGGRSFVKKDF
jgi:Cu-processing system permease protein